MHTGWSADAGAAGTILGPEEATRFARGEEVKSNTGQPVQLGTPLDWVAITDHSDGMGVITEIKGYQVSSAGYTAVWATGNTRAELWDAMKRKETYATSGTRMVVRFFGGYDFTAADVSRTPAVVGYEKGVAMGGDLPAAPAGKAPTFLVAALKDPKGGNLDRIQVIKGWLDKSGKPQERIFDVVWGDAQRRKIVNGKLTPVGNTVDVTHATWTNTIGDPELTAVWKDPEFDPSVRAFYYLRVLEIPTPRWTCYDAVRFNVKMAPHVPMTTQERAFTSPIWYTPGK